jgi:hypothetical protein
MENLRKEIEKMFKVELTTFRKVDITNVFEFDSEEIEVEFIDTNFNYCKLRDLNLICDVRFWFVSSCEKNYHIKVSLKVKLLK